jgi:predicted permease
MSLLQDIRLALRLFWRIPFTTAVALLSIALSVGATAVVFTAIKSVLIDPLPYARPGELVQIRTDFINAEPSHGDWVLRRDAQQIIRRTTTLESAGVYGNAIFNLAGDASSAPEALYGLRVTASLFPTLGVTPILGRGILPDEDLPGHPNEMILSYGLWTRRFNKDRNIVGRNVQIDGHDCLIIGVMPPEFNFPMRRSAVHTPSPYVEFLAPMRVDPATAASDPGAIGMVGRLQPNISLAQAEQDLASISNALSSEYPATNRDHKLQLGYLRERTVGSAEKSLWLLMAATVMFLLIGCANVANLLMARGLARQREIAIRIAIGAGRGRIVRQLLTESCVLAMVGGMGGFILTVAAWKVLPAIAPVNIPRLAAAKADWSILIFALLAALINGVLFGVAPALRAVRNKVTSQDFGVQGSAFGGRDRLRGTLVVAEVAVTVTLVIVGGQLLGRFVELIRTDPGFDADHLLASVVIPAPDRYKTREERGVLYAKFLNAVRVLPGVENAGTVDALPFSGENHGGYITNSKAGVMEPSSQTVAEVDVVSADYLQTMGVRLLGGRWFQEEDMKASSDTAIVNDVVAARMWPGYNPLDQQICVYCTPENPNNWKRVVGVVSAVRHAAMDTPEQPSVYLSAAAPEKSYFLVVSTSRPTKDLETGIRKAIASVDPNQPVFLSASMRGLVADSLANHRFIMSLLVITACLALSMSIAGVYGVTSYTTSRRTQEIGVRMALGAPPGNVQLLVFRQGFFTTAIGLMIGLGVTLVLVRLLRGILAGLESGRFVEIFIAMGLVSLTSAIACWLPARRAARIEPMSALRHD